MKKTILIQNILIILLLLCGCSVFYLKKIDNNAITQQNIQRLNKHHQTAKMMVYNAEKALEIYFRYDYNLRFILNNEAVRRTFYDLKNNLERQINSLYPVVPTIFDISRNDIINYSTTSTVKMISYEKLKRHFQTFQTELDSYTLDTIKSLDIYNSLSSEVDSLLKRQNHVLNCLKNEFEIIDSTTMVSLDSNQQILLLKNLQRQILTTEYELTLNWIFFSEVVNEAKKVKYQIVLFPERMARVNEPFKADIFLSDYFSNRPLSIKVNNQRIATKKGIGYFDFMATKKGENVLDIEVNCQDLLDKPYSTGRKSYVVVR